MDKFKNNKIIKAAICLSVVIAMVSLTPVPTRINTDLRGVLLVNVFTDDYVNISIQGWHLHYLFQPDEIKGTVTITPYEFEESKKAVYKFLGETFTPPDYIDIRWSTLIRYSARENAYSGGTIFFNKNFKSVIVSGNRGYYYVAPAKTHYELEEILKYFEGYIDVK